MRQALSLAALFTFAVACTATPADSPDPKKASPESQAHLVEQLAPLLREAGRAGRVNYRGVCESATGFGRLSFPDTSLRVPSSDKSGVDAIRNLLPPEAELVEKAGIISINLGDVPDEILHTRISRLEFVPDEQFTEFLAIMAIHRNPDVQAAAQRLGYALPIEDISILPVSPRDDSPHLPQSFSGLTLDQVLNEVAKTFGGIVFFGACEGPRLYSIHSGHS